NGGRCVSVRRRIVTQEGPKPRLLAHRPERRPSEPTYLPAFAPFFSNHGPNGSEHCTERAWGAGMFGQSVLLVLCGMARADSAVAVDSFSALGAILGACVCCKGAGGIRCGAPDPAAGFSRL